MNYVNKSKWEDWTGGTWQWMWEWIDFRLVGRGWDNHTDLIELLDWFKMFSIEDRVVTT